VADSGGSGGAVAPCEEGLVGLLKIFQVLGSQFIYFTTAILSRLGALAPSSIKIRARFTGGVGNTHSAGRTRLMICLIS